MEQIISMIVVVFGIALAVAYKLFSGVLGWFFDYGWKLFFVCWAVFVLAVLLRTTELLEQIRKSIDAKGK